MFIKSIRLFVFLLVVMIFIPGIVSAEADKGEKSAEYVSNKLLVKFYPEATDEKKASIRKELGVELIKCLKEINIEVWKLPDSFSMDDVITKLKEEKSVEYSEPDYIYQPQSTSGSDRLNRQWHLSSCSFKRYKRQIS